MSMGRSPANESCADPPAAGAAVRWRAVAAVPPHGQAGQANSLLGGDMGAGTHRDLAAAAGRRRTAARLCAGQLAAAVRHHPHARPSERADAAGHRCAGGLCRAVRLPGRRRAWAEFPCALSVPVARHQRCLPHRRPVQPVRFLRDPADLVLCLAVARARPAPGSFGHALCGAESARLVAVPDRRKHALRPAGHPEHGRSGGSRQCCRSGGRALARCGRLSAAGGVRPQGAILPLYFWLPRAMHRQRPRSLPCLQS